MQQAMIDRGVGLLEKLAAERGNAIDASRLTVDDLTFLAELPVSWTGQRLAEGALSTNQARHLHALLDRAAALYAAAQRRTPCRR